MQRKVTLIFGQTGSGKTTAARQLLSSCPRALVVDAGFGEFPARMFSEFIPLIEHLDAIRAFPTGPARPSFVPFRVAYAPRSWEHGPIFSAALELQNLTLFLEEADRFDDPRLFPEYDEIITRGRHFGISIVAVGLHPFKLPTELRRQATAVIAFRQIAPDDIKYLQEIIGDAALTLPDLPPFHKIVWTPSTGARSIGPDAPLTL